MNFPASLRHVCGSRSLIICQNDQEKVMWLGRQTPYSANKQHCDLRMLQTSEPTRKTLAKTFGRQSFFYYEPHDIYIYIYIYIYIMCVCVCLRVCVCVLEPRFNFRIKKLIFSDFMTSHENQEYGKSKSRIESTKC